MRRRSLRFQLTVWYAVILTAGLSLFGGLIWWSLRTRLISEVDRDLQGRAARFEAYFRTEAAELAEGQLRDELEEFCQALPPSSYIFVQGSSGFTFHYPADAPAVAPHVRIVRQQFTVAGEVFNLEVGAPIRDMWHTLELLRLLLLSLIPIVIAIACLGGLWLSRRALKPVDDITAAARTIGIENLSERLPVPGTGDELARLTDVLNTMLERLESAVKTLSQFVADASHELRTPLAVIRTTAELAARRARSPEVYRESLEEVVAETERMTKLVEDLLFLARTDTASAGMPLQPVDVRDVVSDVCSEIRGLAQLRQLHIRVVTSESARENPAIVAAHRPSLHRLFLVLLDNALKYSRPGQDVIVTVDSRDSQISVTIHDFGVGISEADLPHIFKRFYQADRARSSGGHGLGLSLAESIAHVHGAVIEVSSREGHESIFRVVFPARSANRIPAVIPSGVGVVPSAT